MKNFLLYSPNVRDQVWAKFRVISKRNLINLNIQLVWLWKESQAFSCLLQVSTHPLTGKVDRDYQLTITQRYADLMKRLKQLGYKTNLHPAFAEFVVNTYGILNEKPNESTQQVDYNNPEFLCKVIMKTAPIKLQKDLLLFLICLCSMAEMDREPLLLW